LSANPGSHWFDRLTVTLTRREALKGAVGLAGVAFGVSAARPQAAVAFDPNACETGCYWTAHQTYQAASDGCASTEKISGYGGLPTLLLLGPIGLAIAPVVSFARYEAAGVCYERALTQQKADYFDCQTTGCGGFNPKQKGGPCETCTATCCADPTVISGYSCCALGCACGSDTGACHSGATPC
jgi:hypothetical protein